MHSVEIVAFDAGLTLLHAQPSFWEALGAGVARAGAELPEPDGEAGASWLGEIWREHDAVWRSSARPSPHVGDDAAERDYWVGLYRRLLSSLEVEGDHDEIGGAVYEHFSTPGVFRPFDDVHTTLDVLASRGVRTALLSNWGPGLRDILVAEELLDHFDAVVISGEEGVAKPDTAIFEILLDRLGTTAGPHVAYVGDSPDDDVVPARGIGLQAVLIDRFEARDAELQPRITRLAELDDVLELPGRPGRR